MPRAVDIVTTVDEDGRLPKSRAAFLRGQLQLYAGGQVRIRVSRPKRSTQANAFYWSQVIAPIQRAMAEAGMAASAHAIHRAFKNRYLEPRTEVVFGRPVTLEPTTTELDSTAFSDFIEAIRLDEDVLALGVEISEPDAPLRSYAIAEVA